MPAALGILVFTALGFFLLLKRAAPHHTVSIDTDWFYRKGGQLFYRITVDVLNAVNHVGDVLFVKDILGALIRFAKDGPVWLMHLVVTPYWFLTGYGDRQRKEELYQSARSGTLPLGFAAFFVLVYLVVLFFL